MRYIIILIFLLFSKLQAQELIVKDLTSSDALKKILKVDALNMNKFQFDSVQFYNNFKELIILKDSPSLEYDYTKLNAYYFESFKEIYKLYEKQKSETQNLKTENSNLKIYIDNELEKLKYDIYFLKSEIIK